MLSSVPRSTTSFPWNNNKLLEIVYPGGSINLSFVKEASFTLRRACTTSDSVSGKGINSTELIEQVFWKLTKISASSVLIRGSNRSGPRNNLERLSNLTFYCRTRSCSRRLRMSAFALDFPVVYMIWKLKSEKYSIQRTCFAVNTLVVIKNCNA